MDLPTLDDTIAAVSTAWQAAPVGVLRLSGRDSFALAGALGLAAPVCGGVWTAARVRLDGERTVPAIATWFRGPRSYTGEDVVEVQVPGALPLLTALLERVIAAGARRALPGEFTARALRRGKLAPRQVEGVLALLEAGQAATLRQAARALCTRAADERSAVRERLLDLLARVEAGIDFVDEEDVRFISQEELRAGLEEVRAALATPVAPPRGAALPHVALVGRPNAGKSTLFNALVGAERALVSPIVGTTRDVLTAEIDCAGVRCRLQDCAGLGRTADELARAAYRAARRAAAQADVVLWVHPADEAWSPEEAAAAAAIAGGKGVLVLSKSDRVAPGRVERAELGGVFAACVAVSARTGAGLSELRAALAAALRTGGETPGVGADDDARRAAREAVERALAAAAPEIVALELREAVSALAPATAASVDEAVLSRIFTRFCIGK